MFKALIWILTVSLKSWRASGSPRAGPTDSAFREMSSSVGLQERKEAVRGVYSVVDQLSRTHLNTLERLIFHLVRYLRSSGGSSSPPLPPFV